jgi:hypothetical protein
VPPTSAGETERTREPLGVAGGQLVGWAAVGVINLLVIAVRAFNTDVPLGIRAAHALYDLGHHVGLGVVSYLAIYAWNVLGPRRQRWAWLALAGTTVLVSALLLPEDVDGLALRLEAFATWVPWLGFLLVLGGSGVPLAIAFGRLLDRDRWRWLAVAIAVSAQLLNHLVLLNDYPGIHFFTAWCAAGLLGAAASGLTRPSWPLGRRRVVVFVALAVAVSAAYVVRPTQSVWRELFRNSGSVVAPFIARVYPTGDDASTPHPFVDSPWFQPRHHMDEVAPTGAYSAPEQPLILLLFVDALRTELVLDERHRAALPELHALADEALLFTLARAPATSTVTSFISIFTGKYYSSLYFTNPDKRGYFPSEDTTPRLAQLLDAADVHTINMLGLWGLGASDGVGAGFDEELRAGRDYEHADKVASAIIERLKEGVDGPTLLFTHFADPHAPYNLAGSAGTPYQRYIREAQLVDRAIGRIREYLTESGLNDRTILIVSGDHGESFGEHGVSYHATTAYEEVLQVPLIIRGPNIQPRRVGDPVSLMDLGPTILDMFDLPTPGYAMGQSLAPYLAGGQRELERPIAVDASKRIRAMVFPSGIKVIENINRGTVEIYDLSQDPAEKRNLIDELGPEGRSYVAAMRSFFYAHRLPRPGYVPPTRAF